MNAIPAHIPRASSMLCSISIQSTISLHISGVGKYGIALSPLGSQSSNVLLESFVGNLGPILYKRFSLLSRGKSRLREIPFNLGNAYLLVGRIHKEIDGIQHSQLERELLMFLDRIMIKFFRAVADLSGRIINAVSQNISDSFPVGHSVK